MPGHRTNRQPTPFPPTTAVLAASPISPGRPNLLKGMSFTFLIEDVHHGVHDGGGHTLAAEHLTTEAARFCARVRAKASSQDDDGSGLTGGEGTRQSLHVFFAGEPSGERLEVIEPE